MIAQPHFYPFEVYSEQMSSWDLSPKVFNFFEIIQILDGKGDRYFNHMRLPYHPGQLLIYTPQDCRSFIIEEPTRFLFIRFSDVLFANCETNEERQRLHEWMKSLEYLFLNHNNADNDLVKNQSDCDLVKSIMATIATEALNPQLYSRSNIQHSLQVLLNIFARNILPDVIPAQTPVGEAPLIKRLVGYIRKHIHETDKLRIENLASVAGLSQNYVGEYFKNQTGQSIREYVLQYRLHLVQIRLQYSDLTVFEIAHEFGFVDESHLSKLFKKYFSDSPIAFRKKNSLSRGIEQE